MVEKGNLMEEEGFPCRISQGWRIKSSQAKENITVDPLFLLAEEISIWEVSWEECTCAAVHIRASRRQKISLIRQR